MGLSAPRNRVKLSKDPNNTSWSRSTDRFGHKILTTYGWAPGTPLGAENAAQATHYTAATFSHIRTVLKDDTRGLGYKKKPAAENDTFGLNMFQNVLGRLNGKDDAQLQKDSQNMRDVNLRLYQERKFGAVTFVHGGFLVGDRVERTLPGAEKKTPSSAESKAAGKVTRETSEPSRQKRKRDAESADQSSSEEQASASDRGSETEDISREDEREARRERKRQKRAKKELKEQKREDKRRRKQQRKEEKEAKAAASGISTPAGTSGTSTPVAASGTSTPSESSALAAGRQGVRRRFIMQKRMALTSETALKEIFMLKAN